MSWTAPNAVVHTLEGLRVLVVDDEAVIALEIEYVLAEAGAAVVGPTGAVDEALALIQDETLSAAVLDVRLGGESIEAVAEALCEREVPFIFYSGQVQGDPILYRWPQATFVAKPAPARVLTEAVRRVVDGACKAAGANAPDQRPSL